ncbi:thiazole tautomerase TenI [Cytobacillus sp. IB215665]|uniref:thiazole tautomerase TenI n=1 Tax=Cytobacillus sp. IB215665 TaxID=3097357 RepID=UPI002A0B00AD|nr:thiazole tautomerase TenI [Cytobacillus sp. IB215665]MDX8364742.1 thiazole tautomerase TenI [Cytobacillus sp. IB215665]
MANKELHIVSTGIQSINTFVSIISEIHPFATAIHLREKQMSARDLYQMINQLIQRSVPLNKIVINDRIDVASVAEVGGVQLAYHSLSVSDVKRVFPKLRIGKSVHSLEEAVEAELQGADYVMYGHIYPTSSKKGVIAKGVDSVKEFKKQLSIPLIAIGGIKPIHIPELIDRGVDGVAVLSGVLLAQTPIEAVKEYSKMLSKEMIT